MKENNDYSELIEYLDGKFGKVDQRFEQVDQRFLTIETDLKELKGMFSDLQSSVDAFAKQGETYFQEMLMLAHKVERHERWLLQIAEKLGIKLEI